METKDIITLLALITLLGFSAYSAFMPKTSEPIVIDPVITTETEIVYVNQTEVITVPEIVYIETPAIDSFNNSYCRVSNSAFNGTITSLVRGTCTPSEVTMLLGLLNNSTPANMSDMMITIAK